MVKAVTLLPRSLALLTLTLLLGSTGCVGASLAEKRDSFRPYEGAVVGKSSLRAFVRARTYTLLRGVRLRFERKGGETVMELISASPKQAGFGTAAAITSDGYFLTAAHNLRGELFHLVALGESGLRIGRARVVWRGSPGDPRADFALLHVAGAAGRAFAWAERGAVERGTELVAAGTARPLEPLSFAGGEALGAISTPRGSPPASLVLHGVPVRRGDSGGPLVTREGRLVALNVIYAPLTGRHVSVRPDPDWVARLIALDRRQRRLRAPAIRVARPGWETSRQ